MFNQEIQLISFCSLFQRVAYSEELCSMLTFSASITSTRRIRQELGSRVPEGNYGFLEGAAIVRLPINPLAAEPSLMRRLFCATLLRFGRETRYHGVDGRHGPDSQPAQCRQLG